MKRMRRSDTILYWSIVGTALCSGLAAFAVIAINLNQLENFWLTNTVCFKTNNFECLLDGMLKYNMFYSAYYHIVAAVLSIASVLSSAIIVFLWNNRPKRQSSALGDSTNE